MAALLYWVRSDLRDRRWAAVGLALLVALAMVVPFTAAAAARRTDSTLSRMRTELQPAHGDVQFEDDEPPPGAIEAIAAIPGVEHVGEGVAILAHPVGSELDFFESFGQGARGDALMRDFDRPRIEHGRMPSTPEETLVSTALADELGLAVGDEVRIETFSADGLWAALGGESFEYDGPVLELEVVGIGDQPEAVTGGGPDAVAPSFLVSSDFLSERDGEIGWFDGIFVVHLRGGVAGMPALEEAVREAFPDRTDIGVNTSEEQARIQQAVDAQAVGLALLAAVAAVAAAVAVGQAARRFSKGSSSAEPILAAVGMRRRDQAASRVAAALVPALAGSIAAAAAAFGASGLFPTGAAGRVEPDPGPALDVVVLVPGVLLTVVLATACAALGPRRDAGGRQPGWLASRISACSLPVATMSGLRATLAGGKVGAAPARSAMVAGVAGVAGVLAALVFGASLARLTDTPTRYGWNWDFDVGLGDLLTDEEALASARRIEGDDRISSAMVARIDNVILDGREEFAYARMPVVGDLHFSVVEGRPPESANEIALGATSLDSLDVSIGDTVTAEGADGRPVTLEVVGQALFPIVENEDPARGVALPIETYERLLSPGSGFPELYVRAADGADLDALATDLEELGFVTSDVAPPAITNLRGVDAVPFALASFLAALAVAACTHALLTAVRGRRRELAVLKTLGFVRRQLATTVVVQALTFAVAGLVIGLPLGFVIGRQAWMTVAGGLGFATDALVPGWALLVVPGAIGALILVAVAPARSAARIPTADLLRSE